MDILEQGLAWLEEQRHKHRTRSATFVRGALSVDVPATIGRTIFEQTNAFGVVERFESRDFLIRAVDLMLAGSPTLPRRGDKVRETQGFTVFLYEVMAPGTEPEWRYSDPYRKTLRIHTKLVGTEAVP